MTAALLPWLLLAVAAPTDDPKAAEYAPVVRDLLEAHNRVRAEHGLAPLRLDPELTEAARAHARDMAEHEVMAHEGSDGSGPADRVRRAGYRFRRTGENVAAGQRSVEQVIEGWMDSPPHRENILGPFTELGAARVEAADGRPYWAVSFGTPMPRLDPEEAASGLIARINDLRREAGEPDLEPSPPLARAAEAAVAGLAAADPGPAGKEGPPGDEAKDEPEAQAAPQAEPPDIGALVRREGYRYRRIQSTTARGTPTPEELADSLAEDGSARAVLLGDFRHVGVAYAQAEDATPYWVVILGTPRPGR